MRKATAKTVLALALLLPGAAKADDADIIAYRQQMMKSLDAQFEAVMLILTARAPEAHILQHMEALEEIASLGFGVFEQKALGGKSSPKVWENWSEFSAVMKEFDERLKTAVAMTRTKGAPGALQGLEFVRCRTCHDAYRTEP